MTVALHLGNSSQSGHFIKSLNLVSVVFVQLLVSGL